MKSKEFVYFRKKLNKTQKQMSELLGISIKAVHSYEQGWRSIPPHVERQMLFLITCKTSGNMEKTVCWKEKNARIKGKRHVLPGNLMREISAGLSMVRFAMAKYWQAGKKK